MSDTAAQDAGGQFRYCDAFSFRSFYNDVQEVRCMGQIIAFPLPPTPYPDLAADLDKAEGVLLVAVRWWVACFRAGEDPIPRLRQGLTTAGSAAAASSIDGLMMVVSRTVTRPVEIRCPRCPNLSLDERHLLHAASLAQAGDADLAAKVLRRTLLSAQGAEFALGSLEGLGTLFTQARLLLSRRRFSEDGQLTVDGRESWSPSSTVH
jgi:hypothetical protein